MQGGSRRENEPTTPGERNTVAKRGQEGKARVNAGLSGGRGRREAGERRTDGTTDRPIDRPIDRPTDEPSGEEWSGAERRGVEWRG